MLEHNEFHLYLCRHGQSEVNVMPDMVGQREDTKLTTKGRNQAHCLGQRITKKEITHVYSSDLTRAADTCRIALSASIQPLSVDPHFILN